MIAPMQTSAKIICDSISEHGDRLTTMEVTLHRFVLAEFNTHRVFSRNSASSRAIPVEKQLAKVKDHPAWPLEWPCEQPGMQGGSALTDGNLDEAQALFLEVHAATTEIVDFYLETHPNKEERLHKSLINRLLEPFMWHTIVVTSTEWENFFTQRCSPLAQPEIRAAAELMQKEYENHQPWLVREGEWHLPYVQYDEMKQMSTDIVNKVRTKTEAYGLLVKLSAARCARVSYLTQDGVRDWDKDFELYERLTTADPPHWSPLEHVARPVTQLELSDIIPGNFQGWVQLRHDNR